MSITIIEVFRSLNIEPTPAQSWSVGATVASMYRKTFDSDPPMERRTKTSGKGSHCFAVYPKGWRGRIEEAIKAVAAPNDKQLSLLGDE